MYKLYSAGVDYRYTHQKFLPAIPIAPKKREDIHEVALFVTSNSYLISKKYIPRLLLIPNVFPRIKKAAIITIQPHPPFGDCLSVIISSIFFILSIVSGLPLTMADCCYTAVASLRRSGGEGAAYHGCHYFGVKPFGYFIWSPSFIWTENALNSQRRPFFGLHFWTENPLSFR